MLGYIFPGQGSQRVGMGKKVFAEFPELVEKASQILGYSVKDLCLLDRDKLINDTRYTQPLLFTVNYLTYLHSANNRNEKPGFLAGHSLGEYSALCASGAFDFETGLKIVNKRGQLMSQTKNGGMAAVIGQSEEAIIEILNRNNFDRVFIANINSSKQLVISGDLDQLLLAEEVISSMPATYFIKLKTSGAFHSKYLEHAALELQSYLKECQLNTPKIDVLSNYTALPYPKDEKIIIEYLVKQMYSKIRWNDCVLYMKSKGINYFVEAGPGNVLTKLLGDI